jgi:hypothetical protein
VGRFFESGRIVDCILALMLIELLVLPWAARRFRVRIRVPELIANLGAGAALLLALRAALRSEAWPHSAAWLLIALAFHLMETGLRWSRGRSR